MSILCGDRGGGRPGRGRRGGQGWYTGPRGGGVVGGAVGGGGVVQQMLMKLKSMKEPEVKTESEQRKLKTSELKLELK